MRFDYGEALKDDPFDINRGRKCIKEISNTKNMSATFTEVHTTNPAPTSTTKILHLRNIYKKDKKNNSNKENKLELQKINETDNNIQLNEKEKKKKREISSAVDRVVTTLTHSNLLGGTLNHQLRAISRDVTAMQEMADLLESEKQTEFLSIVQVYNKIIQDVCHFSINQRCIINKIMVSIELKDIEMFLHNIAQVDPSSCKQILHDITDFSTLLTNFIATLKVLKTKLYKDWKFWLGVTIGGISAVAAVMTLGLAVWVEIAIAAGLVSAGALFGSISLWGINRRSNKKRMNHLNDLKETLKRADSHLIRVKGAVTKIGDKFDYFIEQMFENPQLTEIILKTMEMFNELDDLLSLQVC